MASLAFLIIDNDLAIISTAYLNFSSFYDGRSKISNVLSLKQTSNTLIRFSYGTAHSLGIFLTTGMVSDRLANKFSKLQQYRTLTESKQNTTWRVSWSYSVGLTLCITKQVYPYYFQEFPSNKRIWDATIIGHAKKGSVGAKNLN